jgi:cell wall assembly regulator SMI1
MTGTRFHRSWSRFESWLAANSPEDHALLRAGASPYDIARVERELGFALHPHLRALFELHDGVREEWPAELGGFMAGFLLPGSHIPHGLDRALEDHRMFARTFEDVMEEDGPFEDGAEPLIAHAHQWVPFAHSNDAGTVFVDHHPGPGYGHVHTMGVGAGDVEGEWWATDLAEFFDKLADCLTGSTSLGHHTPTMFHHPSGRARLDW